MADPPDEDHYVPSADNNALLNPPDDDPVQSMNGSQHDESRGNSPTPASNMDNGELMGEGVESATGEGGSGASSSAAAGAGAAATSSSSSRGPPRNIDDTNRSESSEKGIGGRDYFFIRIILDKR